MHDRRFTDEGQDACVAVEPRIDCLPTILEGDVEGVLVVRLVELGLPLERVLTCGTVRIDVLNKGWEQGSCRIFPRSARC